MSVVASVVDPDGRTVVLDSSGWDHIRIEHPEIRGDDVALEAIRFATYREPDPRSGRERFWRRGLGPSRWLLVVLTCSAGWYAS